jgi:hypothetical protein
MFITFSEISGEDLYTTYAKRNGYNFYNELDCQLLARKCGYLPKATVDQCMMLNKRKGCGAFQWWANQGITGQCRLMRSCRMTSKCAHESSHLLLTANIAGNTKYVLTK